jgi:hypothetical protein
MNLQSKLTTVTTLTDFRNSIFAKQAVAITEISGLQKLRTDRLQNMTEYQQFVNENSEASHCLMITIEQLEQLKVDHANSQTVVGNFIESIKNLKSNVVDAQIKEEILRNKISVDFETRELNRM